MFEPRHLQLEQQCNTALLRREPAGARGGTVAPCFLYAGRRVMGRKMKELWEKIVSVYIARHSHVGGEGREKRWCY